MDIQLILGPNNSGKSLFAEKLATKCPDCPRYYIATMIPQNAENDLRIEKHRRQRNGKNFTTIEEPWDIHTLNLPENSVVLLEDASNLLANGIFLHDSDMHETFSRIMTLADKCRQLIVVNISDLTEGDYDKETNDYIRQMNQLNEHLEQVATNCLKFGSK